MTIREVRERLQLLRTALKKKGVVHVTDEDDNKIDVRYDTNALDNIISTANLYDRAWLMKRANTIWKACK